MYSLRTFASVLHAVLIAGDVGTAAGEAPSR